MIERRLAPAAALLALSLAVGACSTRGPEGAPLDTVPRVDLARYAGQWYEVARLPNRFQAECAGDVTAFYAVRNGTGGLLDVVNACRRPDGTLESANGVARVSDPSTNAKLEVRFAPAALAWLPQVWGDYWVIALDPDYRYALVGEPTRRYLWMLSRTPSLPPAAEDLLVEAARRAGYDPSRLQRTSHRAAGGG